MSRSTYFLQECPTCGRRLQIQVRDLGRSVGCGHCEAHFIAADPEGGSISSDDPIADLLNRAESYLNSSHAEPLTPPKPTV